LLIPFARFRPVQNAVRIRGPVLVQLGEQDGMVPLAAIEKVSARAPKGELMRYPIDHFGCFWPEHIEHVARDQLVFLQHQLLTPKTHHTPARRPLTTPHPRSPRPSRTHPLSA
jgi:hypothetical protein